MLKHSFLRVAYFLTKVVVIEYLYYIGSRDWCMKIQDVAMVYLPQIWYFWWKWWWWHLQNKIRTETTRIVHRTRMWFVFHAITISGGSDSVNILGLVLSQDVHFFYRRSHLSALQSCVLLFSDYFLENLNSAWQNLVIELCRALKTIKILKGYLVHLRTAL